MGRKSKKKRQAQILHRQMVDHFSNKPDAEATPAVIDHVSHVVAYDENLLERARTQWQFGDWVSLTKLDRTILQNHPDRAKLALLAAAGHFHSNNNDAVRQFIRLAQNWGCSKRLVSQVLVAGVHNSLGRAAAATGQDQRAVKHFEDAIRIVAPNTDVGLWGHARSVKEMTDIGLLPQATTKIDELRGQMKQLGRSTFHAEAHAKVLDMEVDLLRGRVYSLQKHFDQAKASNLVVGQFAGTKSNPLEKNSNTLQKIYYGLNDLDKKLEAYIDYDNGYFVELGANDGISQSNTAYFEKARGWRGLLVEPILHNFLKCKTNRSSENSYACAACVSFSYRGSHVQLVYSNLMTTPLGVESDLPDQHAHAESGKVYLTNGEAPVEISAPAKTLHALLEDARAPHIIDLLSLDVEGGEIEVLKGVDHQNYRFKYLLIECRNFANLQAYLNDQGYVEIDKLSAHDYLFADQRITKEHSSGFRVGTHRGSK